jgi:hypothetical protein
MQGIPENPAIALASLKDPVLETVLKLSRGALEAYGTAVEQHYIWDLHCKTCLKDRPSTPQQYSNIDSLIAVS